MTFTDKQRIEILAEEFESDAQASIVLLAAHDLLHRFAVSIINDKKIIKNGFGPKYGREAGKLVPFTKVVWAALNALRHVSEWEEIFKNEGLPYPTLSKCNKRSSKYKAMESIEVIQQVFGVGIHERIRQPVSNRVLVAVDGFMGTATPSYDRFEKVMLSAAWEIAKLAGGNACLKLESVLLRI